MFLLCSIGTLEASGGCAGRGEAPCLTSHTRCCSNVYRPHPVCEVSPQNEVNDVHRLTGRGCNRIAEVSHAGETEALRKTGKMSIRFGQIPAQILRQMGHRYTTNVGERL